MRDCLGEDGAGRPGKITKLEKKEERERAQLLYDLTSLQRHANTLFGFSAKRTLAAGQRLYEEHKAITYPRTNSRFLTGDLVAEIRPTAELVGRDAPEYAAGARYVTGLEKLPLGRVVNDAKVEDHHAIIPTRSEHDLSRMGEDERKVYDLVAKRFLAIFHPDAVYERTRVETTVAYEHVFRTSGRVLLEAGWRAVYGQEARGPGESSEDDAGGDQLLPKLEDGEGVDTRSVESLRKETQPPRRFSEASLLGAMETAGRDVEEAEVREAMKDSGIGTPATRASIIERLIDVAYIEREGRALHATDKGLQVIGLLGEHPLTSAQLTGDWERRLGQDRAGRGLAAGLHGRHRQVHHRHRGRARQAQGREDRAGQPGPMPDLRPRRDREPQGLLVLVEGGPGLRLRGLEAQGRQEPPTGGRQGADGGRAPLARGRRGAGGRAHGQAGDRLQGPLGPDLPGQAQARAGCRRPRNGGPTSTRSGPSSRASRRPRARSRPPPCLRAAELRRRPVRALEGADGEAPGRQRRREQERSEVAALEERRGGQRPRRAGGAQRRLAPVLALVAGA